MPHHGAAKQRVDADDGGADGGGGKEQVCVIRGVEVCYEVLGHGAGTPVVITPGGGGGRGALRWLAQRLKAGRKVIIWDRRARAYGASGGFTLSGRAVRGGG